MQIPTYAKGALCAFALAISLSAQSPIVAPPGHANTEGNASSSYPWNRQASELRIQYIYDSTTFTNQNVTGAISIEKLRFRANGSTTATWAGGTYSDVEIRMSTSPVDHLDATATFADNRGSDEIQVFKGAVTVKPSPTVLAIPQTEWYVEITLQTPFDYYPAHGDLCVEYIMPANMWSGTTSRVDLVTGANALGSRIYNDADITATTATAIESNSALVCEFSFVPATGLFPSFDATPATGGQNLVVTFTDTSYTSSPVGVFLRTWDFGDGSATVTGNPVTHTYTCGTFSPKLTATDVTGSKSYTATDLIKAGVVTASFSSSITSGPAPLAVTFTDLSTAGTTAWSWDFGDGSAVVNTQNPTHTFTKSGLFAVSLTITGPCNTDTQTNYILVGTCLETTFSASHYWPNPGSTVLFDVLVSNPDGVKVHAIQVNTRSLRGSPTTMDIYISNGGNYASKHTNAAVWTKVSTGAGVSEGPGNRTPIDVDDFFLPPGNFAMCIQYVDAQALITNQNITVSNADITITTGMTKNGLFNANNNPTFAFNGTLCYTANDEAANGPYGFGCQGSNGMIPRMALSAEPVIGTNFNIEFSDMLNVPAGTGLLLTGLTRQELDLTIIGMPGCTMFHDANLLTVPFVNTNGTATLPAALPNNVALVGGQVFLQGANGDPTVNTLGLVTTPGHGVRIGN